jgi:hypothetical protein
MNTQIFWPKRSASPHIPEDCDLLGGQKRSSRVTVVKRLAAWTSILITAVTVKYGYFTTVLAQRASYMLATFAPAVQVVVARST